MLSVSKNIQKRTCVSLAVLLALFDAPEEADWLADI